MQAQLSAGDLLLDRSFAGQGTTLLSTIVLRIAQRAPIVRLFFWAFVKDLFYAENGIRIVLKRT